VTENYSGTVVGALLGGLLGGPAGAVVAAAGLGALVGTGANPQKPLPLETALAQYIAASGLTFGGMERRAWYLVRVVFGIGANYFYVDAAAAADRTLYPNADALDDALYDVAVREIAQKATSLHGVG
jgi:hypothetical protein